MIDDKYLALMHGEIDGVNSTKESAQLRAYLDAHPEARQLYDELTSVSALLHEVNSVEPPPHLQHTIMRALPLRDSAAMAKRNFLGEGREWLANIFEIKYAFAFAGGIAAGVLLFALFWPMSQKENAVEQSKLYGTIGAPQTEEKRAGEKRLEIQHPEVAGTISLKNAGEIIAVEIALASAQPLDLVISFEEKTLTFKSFIRGEGEAAPAAIALHAGSINLTHTGHQSYTLVFEKHDATALEMNFQVERMGKMLYENKIGF